MGAGHLKPLRPYLELVRLPAVFTAPSDVLAGAALAGAVGAAVPAGAVALLVVASAAIYCAGMAANDLCDAAVDARERPGRPIPSGRVPRRAAWALVITLQAGGAALAGLVGAAPLLALLGTVALTWLYNGALKSGPAGPLVMGACRYGNAVIGLAGAGWPVAALAWWAPAGTLAYVAALTFLSRSEAVGAGAGARITAPALAMLVLAAYPAAWALSGALPVVWGAAAAALPVAWLAGPLLRAHRDPTAAAVRGAVMAGIFGIAMVNAALAVAAGCWIHAALAVGLLVPGRAFGRWFYAT